MAAARKSLLATKMASLAKRVAEIRQRGGKHVFEPPMSAAEVAALETTLGPLPAEYRAFLLEVSAGGRPAGSFPVH
jgi:hypothetical protein